MIAVVAIALTTYLRTLAPTITWAHNGADGGDLITAVATQGIPHPTGYPTYLLLGRLFLLVPWGDQARRLNLMSAVFAALTAGLLYLIVLCTFRLFGDRRIALRERLLAAASALAFAFSPLLWSQALIAEVYTLNAFFVALTIALVLRWMEERKRGFLIGAAFAYGLGLGNHLTLSLVGPAIALLVLLRRRLLPDGIRHVMVVIPALLLGLSVYVILPLRASRQPAVNWGDPRTLDRFLWLVSGRLYRRYFFSLPLHHLPSRLSAWAGLLVRQFGWWGVFPALVGVWSLWERAREFAVFSLAMLVAFSTYAIAYDTADSHVYLVPVFLVFALCLAWGLEHLLAELQRLLAPADSWVIRALPWCLVLVIPLLSLWSSFSSLDLSSEQEARDYGLGVLETVEPGAIIVTQNDPHTFTLNYFRYAEEKRLDVALLDSHLLSHDWYRRHLPRIHPHIDLPGQVVRVGGGEAPCVPSLLVTAIDLNWQ
ncbi:MAG: DUF2723 domain-containing protein, partial [Anaerolineae bacterium]